MTGRPTGGRLSWEENDNGTIVPLGAAGPRLLRCDLADEAKVIEFTAVKGGASSPVDALAFILEPRPGVRVSVSIEKLKGIFRWRLGGLSLQTCNPDPGQACYRTGIPSECFGALVGDIRARIGGTWEVVSEFSLRGSANAGG